MTHEHSQWLIHRLKRKEQEYGILLIAAALLMGAVIAYSLY